MNIFENNSLHTLSDRFAYSMTIFFRFIADTFFAKRYGHRAVVLETIAVFLVWSQGCGCTLKSLRSMKAGYGKHIREMLAEAENERMHLMFFIEIAKPNIFERSLVFFHNFCLAHFTLCMFSLLKQLIE